MQNYETYEELMSQFGKNDHIGSAMQENAKYIDSVSGKLAQLKATWTGIASTVFQSDTIKGFLEGFNSVSEVIGNVISKIDEMGLGLPATIGAFATFGKLFSSIKEAGSITGGISSFIKGIGSFLGQASEIKSVSDYFSLISKNAKGAGSSVVGVADDIAEMAVETATATTGSVGLGTALKGLAKIALPIAGVVALGVAIKKGTDYIEEQRTASTKHYNELGKEVSEYKKSISELDAESGSLDRLYDRYKELSGITNKTKEQQEEYNALLNEVAKINPDLVLFDDAGNAIGLRIGELQDYQREIEKTKRELENLLNAGLEDRMKLGYDSYQDGLTDYQSQISELAKFREEFLTGRNGLPKDGGDLVGSVIAGYEGADKNANEYFSKLNEFKQKEQEFINQVVADRKQVSQSSSEWLESIFGQNDKLENAGKKRQQAMDSILNLDYSQFNGDQMEKLGNKLNDWLGSASYADVGAFDNYIAKVNDLNKAWQDGEITSATYKNSVNDIAKTLSELTGGKISTEEWAKMLKLPEFDVESAYKTFSDLEEAQQTLQEKVNRMAQIESQEGRISMAYEILQDERVPMEIKQSIDEMLSDGKITDQELEVLLDLIAKLEENDLENTINEELDKLSDEEKITKEVAVEYALKVENGVDFDQYLQEIITPEEGGITLAVDIQTDMDTGNLESLKNDLAQLPEEKQIGIMVAAASSGEYTPQELHSFLSVLPEEVQTQIIAAIEQSGTMTPEELDTLINGTPDNTDKTINIKENGGQSTLNTLNQIEENTGDKSQTVSSKDSGGSGLLTTLRQIKNNTKNGSQTVTSKDSGGSGLLATLKGIVQNTKNKSQTVSSKDSGGSGLLVTLRQIKSNTKNGSQTITTKDSGGSGTLSTLRSIAGSVKNRTQTITTVFKTIGSAVKSIFGPSSTTEFTNVSDTPTEVSTSGIEAKNVSDTPTESESTNDGSSSGTFSAKGVDSVYVGSTKSTRLDLSYDSVWSSIKYGIELFQELDNRISVVNNSIDLLETKLKNSIGGERIKDLKDLNKMYSEQAKLQETLYNSLSSARNHAGSMLKNQGFNIDSQGNLTNYEEKLAQLEKRAKSASDAAKNYKGDSESYRDSLSKEADRQSDILDSAIKTTKEYFNLQYKEIPEAQKEWQSLQNSIEETNAEIKKLEFEAKIKGFTAGVEQCALATAKLESRIDVLDVKLKRADGTEKVKLLAEQILLWDKLKVEQEKSLEDMQKMIIQYEKELSKYGFKFDMGNMVNGFTTLSQLEDKLGSNEFKYVEELVESWKKLYTDSIPNAIESVEKYENSVKDAYEEQLDVTKDVEKQITKMYEKQLEDRIDALKKETSTIVDELEKQKKAYKDMRDEVDYQNEYDEKIEEIEKLNKQLETAKKDNSLGNRKKIADLEKQLSEAQEELNDMVQNKIDSDIDSMFDDKIEQLEENQNTLIEQLESMWTDEKIANMVAESLKTGLFSGLDGQVTDLENALVSFGESTGEMFGVTGALIKEEWIGNLEVALATVKDIKNIMGQLEIPDFSSVNYSSKEKPSITTGNINVTVNAETNASAEDIANQVEKAVNDALKNATEGL